ncbi:MAG: protein kinase domain-containing protein, partial [Verrucomicrobiales bacterium]
KPGFSERFLREARAMAALSHPHIVTVYSFGRSTRGHLYYIMELVDGPSLAELITRKKPTTPEALKIIRQVCLALEHAHSAGLIHRDLKPSNVLLTSGGEAKVADFGLSRLSHEAPGCGLTLTGAILGTPAYMAPEQSRGQATDHRVDLFALGAMLYELLTGQAPQGHFPLPGEVERHFRLFDKVVAKALRPEPQERFQSSAELRQSLEKLSPRSKSRRDEKTPKPRSFTVAAGLLSALILCLLLALLIPRHTEKAHPATPPPWQNSLGLPFTRLPGTQTSICQWETRASDWQLFLRETGYAWTPPPFQLPPKGPALGLSWHDAEAFCLWLSEKERQSGTLAPGLAYRLPTDAEWSLAVGLRPENAPDPQSRSGSDPLAYPWGSHWPPPPELSAEIDHSPALEIAREVIDSPESPASSQVVDKELPALEFDWTASILPVAQTHENPLGIRGLSGGAREWVRDKFYADASPHGPRTLRGGSLRSAARGPESRYLQWINRDWTNPARYFRGNYLDPRLEHLSSRRHSHQPHVRKDWFGFRLALAPIEDEKNSRPQAGAQEDGTFLNSLDMSFLPPNREQLRWSQSELTNAQLRAFRPTWQKNQAAAKRDGGHWPEHPATSLTIQEAHDFAAWLTAREQAAGLLPANARYRLPTLAEWQQLVSSLELELKGHFFNHHDPWRGNFSDATFSLVFKNPHHDSGDDGFAESAPVGSFPARHGLYDLVGNVSEWVTGPDPSHPSYVGSNWAILGHASDFAPKQAPSSDYQSPRIGLRLVLAGMK